MTRSQGVSFIAEVHKSQRAKLKCIPLAYRLEILV